MQTYVRYIGDRIATDLKHHAKKIYRNPVIKLAQLYRPTLRDVQFIGITGSSGKTTAKDLAYVILSSKFRAHKSLDTNNQLYSVARTLLGSPRGTEVCVQEVGASEMDDMRHPVQLLRPDVGVVINIAKEHVKAFRSREAVAQEKIKLVRGLPADGVAVLNADDDLVRAMRASAACRVITFGRGEDCALRAADVRGEWPQRLEMTLTYENSKVACYTQLCGKYFAYSVLAAVAIGLACGMTLPEAVAPVRSFSPFAGRMMPYETPSGVTFIRDDWKAPYWSIEAPLDFIRSAQASRKIVVMGTLSDYSGTSRKKYTRVSRIALDSADHVVFVGPNAHKGLRVATIPDGKTVQAFSTTRDCADHLRKFLAPGDLVLLKGSGGDHLARIALMYARNVRCWRERCGRDNLCDHCRLLSVSERTA